MKRDSFFKGAFLMIVSACLVKIGGALFKIPLSSILGGGGMGLFMAAYSVFNPFHALFASGLSPAVSSFVSRTRILKGEREADDLRYANIFFFAFYGLAAFLIFVYLAPMFAAFTGDENILPCLYTMAPCLFFCSVGSAVRGGFEGNLMMKPTAFSQLAEVFSKFVLGIFLAKLCVSKSFLEFFSFGSINGKSVRNLNTAIDEVIPLATNKALQGVTLASLISCVFLFILYFKERKDKYILPKPSLFKDSLKILKYSVPICLSSLIVSLYPTIDMYSFLNIFADIFEKNQNLPAIFSFLSEEAMEISEIPAFLYGCCSGLAFTIFHFVPALTSSLSVAVLPQISSCYASKNKKKTCLIAKGIIKSVAFVSMPLGVGMFLMPEEILTFFFPKSSLEVLTAVPFLKALGPASVFVGLSSPLFASLQGMGMPKAPTFILSIFLAVKLLLNIVFTIGPLGPLASVYSTLICYMFIFILTSKYLFYILGEKFSLTKLFFKPFLLSAAACCISKIVYRSLEAALKNPLALVISVILGAFMYIIFIFLTGEFKQEYIKILYCDKNK